MFVKENGLSSCVLLLSSLPDPFPPSSVPQSFSPSSEIAVWSLQKLQFLPSLFHISLPLLQELLHVDCKSCVRLPTLLHIPSLILFWNCSVEPTDTAVSPNWIPHFSVSSSGTAMCCLEKLITSSQLCSTVTFLFFGNCYVKPGKTDHLLPALFHVPSPLVQELLCKACKNWLLPPSCFPHSSSSCSGTACKNWLFPPISVPHSFYSAGTAICTLQKLHILVYEDFALLDIAVFYSHVVQVLG